MIDLFDHKMIKAIKRLLDAEEMTDYQFSNGEDLFDWIHDNAESFGKIALEIMTEYDNEDNWLELLDKNR